MLTVADQAERDMFISPATRKKLVMKGGELVTEDGAESFPVRGSRAIFLEAHRDSPMDDEYVRFESRQWLFRLKSRIPYLIRSRGSRQAMSEFERLTTGQFVLGIGGGPIRDFGSVNLNIAPWANVEIVADAHKLPYADDSVDHVSCLAVLEHLSRPDVAVEEMVRVLKPGGLILLESPGLQPYHGYPSHYQNFTLNGHDLLLGRLGLDRIDSGAAIGPTSALTVLNCEYVQRYLPAGRVLAKLLRLLMLPVVQADRWIANHRDAFVLCGSVYFLGRKPLQ